MLSLKMLLRSLRHYGSVETTELLRRVATSSRRTDAAEGSPPLIALADKRDVAHCGSPSAEEGEERQGDDRQGGGRQGDGRKAQVTALPVRREMDRLVVPEVLALQHPSEGEPIGAFPLLLREVQDLPPDQLVGTGLAACWQA